MTSDRELLELAAKAAGYDVHYDELDDVFYFDNEAMVSFFKWNPLTDDGDALRLAVKLGMDVYVDNHPDGCACTEAKSITYGVGDPHILVDHEQDPYAATRRAITRAAAEIARSME